AAATQYISDWFTKSKAAVPFGQYGWPALRDLFIAGRIGIHHDEPTYVGILQGANLKFKWAPATFPKPYGMWKNDRYLSISGLYTIAKTSKQKDAAWAMIKFWSKLNQVAPYFQAVTIMSVRTDATKQMWKTNP